MAKLKLVNGRTAEQWAEIIKEKWQDSVSGILEVGLLLHNAREELDTAEFWAMTRDRLHFSQATVYQLIAVGTHVRFQDYNTLELPASWATLYGLTRLTDEQFQRGVDTGIIHAGMDRKDIAQLKPPKSKLAGITNWKLAGLVVTASASPNKHYDAARPSRCVRSPLVGRLARGEIGPRYFVQIVGEFRNRGRFLLLLARRPGPRSSSRICSKQKNTRSTICAGTPP